MKKSVSLLSISLIAFVSATLFGCNKSSDNVSSNELSVFSSIETDTSVSSNSNGPDSEDLDNTKDFKKISFAFDIGHVLKEDIRDEGVVLSSYQNTKEFFDYFKNSSSTYFAQECEKVMESINAINFDNYNYVISPEIMLNDPSYYCEIDQISANDGVLHLAVHLYRDTSASVPAVVCYGFFGFFAKKTITFSSISLTINDGGNV